MNVSKIFFCIFYICTLHSVQRIRIHKQTSNVLQPCSPTKQLLVHSSLGNSAIQNGIACDWLKTISSKMYFASPTKPAECSKTYYIDDVVNCLKATFQKCRHDSSFQSIHESMTKFKWRSSLKQYMPLKPGELSCR